MEAPSSSKEIFQSMEVDKKPILLGDKMTTKQKMPEHPEMIDE